jgi:hypothetical protein
MQSIYSYYGSRLHLILEDELADNYNRMVKSFMDAQIEHKERTGTQWDPKNESLLMETRPEWKDAYDKVGRVINLLVEINGGGLEIYDEECTEDGLVKL